MKILNIQAPRIVKNLLVATPLLLASTVLKAQNLSAGQDVFVKSPELVQEGIEPSMMLSPEIKVANDTIYPALVVDLSENKLYHYDLDGYLDDVYPIASGKASTPTKPALKVINAIEEYPYRSAHRATKRYKNPNDYGTHLLNLSIVDVNTGEIVGNDGQYIHGTFRPETIGKKVSKGCVRVHNDVVDMLAENLKPGQYVLIRE